MSNSWDGIRESPHELNCDECYEQRHFNRLIGVWSGWYPSSAAAFLEHTVGPVSCYEVRRPSSPLADAHSNNTPPTEIET